MTSEERWDSDHKKKIRFRLSPSLSDGAHWAAVSTEEEVIKAIKEWFGEFKGDECADFAVHAVPMTDTRFKQLKEV